MTDMKKLRGIQKQAHFSNIEEALDYLDAQIFADLIYFLQLKNQYELGFIDFPTLCKAFSELKWISSIANLLPVKTNPKR